LTALFSELLKRKRNLLKLKWVKEDSIASASGFPTATRPSIFWKNWKNTKSRKFKDALNF
jgi:hypothetical protein